MTDNKKQFVLNKILNVKNGFVGNYNFSFYCKEKFFSLKPIQSNYHEIYNNLPALLSRWRKENPTISTGVFEITEERTKKWLENYVLNNNDRIIFMIDDEENNSFGHIGLTNFNFENNTVELDSVLRGVKGIYPGLMSLSVNKIIDFVLNCLFLKGVGLSVFSDNESAISFYNNLGFKTVDKLPLIKVKYPDETKLEIRPKNSNSPIEKYYLKMKLIDG